MIDQFHSVIPVAARLMARERGREEREREDIAAQLWREGIVT